MWKTHGEDETRACPSWGSCPHRRSRTETNECLPAACVMMKIKNINNDQEGKEWNKTKKQWTKKKRKQKKARARTFGPTDSIDRNNNISYLNFSTQSLTPRKIEFIRQWMNGAPVQHSVRWLPSISPWLGNYIRNDPNDHIPYHP